MQNQDTEQAQTSDRRGAGWRLLPALLVLVSFSTLGGLWGQWRTDPSLAHAPLIPLLAVLHLWLRRDQLRAWNSASLPGFILLFLATLLYVAANWADVEVVKPLSLIGMLAGVLWYLGGTAAFRAASGALGFLLLMVPWPETLSAQLQFPMQQTSSVYAALLCGMIGLPVQREGVFLAILPDGAAAPVYRIVVSQQCSGLTSLMALLTMGYLIAYHTPVPLRWRALLLALTVPLTLFANAVRLTLVLLAGMYHGATVAQWVHDHEQPVLILLCSMGLMAARQGLLRWAKPAIDRKERKLARYRLWLANALLLLALLGGYWGRRIESATLPRADFLRRLNLPYKDWTATDFAIPPNELSLLEPDAVLARRYQSKTGQAIELMVVVGHRKRTVHLPGYCMTGSGWDTLSQSDATLRLPDRAVPAARALMTRDSANILATYFFTDGAYSTRSLTQFQAQQIAKRFQSRLAPGALVRIIAPTGGSPDAQEAAARLTDDFAASTLPLVLQNLSKARLDLN